MPTFDELYDRHAPMLYGMALNLTNATCAERALCDACVELWGTPAKCARPPTVPSKVRRMLDHVKEHCLKEGNGEAFKKQLSKVMDVLKEHRGTSPSGESGHQQIPSALSTCDRTLSRSQ